MGRFGLITIIGRRFGNHSIGVAYSGRYSKVHRTHWYSGGQSIAKANKYFFRRNFDITPKHTFGSGVKLLKKVVQTAGQCVVKLTFLLSFSHRNIMRLQ